MELKQFINQCTCLLFGRETAATSAAATTTVQLGLEVTVCLVGALLKNNLLQLEAMMQMLYFCVRVKRKGDREGDKTPLYLIGIETLSIS